MVTIKDVAKKADVSIATVSNYLNRTKPVSKELGARIQNAVDELGYSLNLNAKILKTAQYMDIGVILPSLNDSYYVQLFQGIKTYFQNTNYFINLVFSNNIPELEVTIAQNLKRKQICGLILVSCQPENWKFYYDNFTSKKIPLVLRERGSGTLDILLAALQKHNIKLSDLNVKMYLGSTESIKLFLEHTDCMGIVSIRSVHKELVAGNLRVIEIKGMPMQREFNFVQLQGQEGGLSQVFMRFAGHHSKSL